MFTVEETRSFKEVKPEIVNILKTEVKVIKYLEYCKFKVDGKTYTLKQVKSETEREFDDTDEVITKYFQLVSFDENKEGYIDEKIIDYYSIVVTQHIAREYNPFSGVCRFKYFKPIISNIGIEYIPAYEKVCLKTIK